MQKLITISIFCGIILFTLNAVAQTSKNNALKDTKWLEGQLNELVKEKNTDPKKKQFAFNQCQCEFKAENKNDGGFNFNMNYNFDLKEVSSVSYARNEDNTYDFIIKLKTDNKNDSFNFNSINTTLYTSDEKKVKEVVDTFRSSVKTCNSGNK